MFLPECWNGRRGLPTGVGRLAFLSHEECAISRTRCAVQASDDFFMCILAVRGNTNINDATSILLTKKIRR
jgi:hypothetical protein